MYRTYSGRGMYGDTCLGVTFAHGDVLRFLYALMFVHRGQGADPDDIVEDIAEIMDGTRTDSMGYSTLHYWPSITITD